MDIEISFETPMKIETFSKVSLTQEEKQCLRFVVSKLPEDPRVIVYLRYWRGLDFNEISVVMGISLKEVIFIHNKTLQLLKALFINIGMFTHVAS